jgi:ComF family protein
VNWISAPICPRCGRPWIGGGTCTICRSRPLALEGIRALALFEGVWRTAIHRFKYAHLTDLAPLLSGYLLKYLESNPLPLDGVVAVPLHSVRLRERGYCQSELLARELARGLGLPYWRDMVTRLRNTRPQVGLTVEERWENMRDAFACRGGEVVYRRIVLIDDLCTTGATLDSCARALRAGGARSIWGLALARSAPQSRLA